MKMKRPKVHSTFHAQIISWTWYSMLTNQVTVDISFEWSFGSEWSQLNDLLRHFTPICLQKLYFGPVIHVVYYPKDIIITRVTKPYILTLKMFRRPLKPKYMPLQNMPALPFKSVETANFCSLQMHMDIYELGIVLSSSKMMKKTHFHKLLSYKVLSPHQCSLIQPSLVCSVREWKKKC